MKNKRTDNIPEVLYYIQNKSQYVGNCVLFWRKYGCGYTCNLDDAWKVNKTVADEICKSRPKEDVPLECSKVDQAATRHFDSQKINLIKW